jgi:hypothetical protein
MEEEWVIEHIVRSQNVKGSRDTQYLVKWQDYDEESWHTIGELDEMGVEDIDHHLEAYNERLREKKQAAQLKPHPTRQVTEPKVRPNTTFCFNF